MDHELSIPARIPTQLDQGDLDQSNVDISRRQNQGEPNLLRLLTHFVKQTRKTLAFHKTIIALPD